MRHYLSTYCLLLFLMCCFVHISPVQSQSLQGDSWQQITENGSGTVVVTYFTMDGFAYQDSEGNHTGVSLDIINQFINYVENSYDVELQVAYRPQDDFVAFYNSVKNATGGVIGAGNVTITEERKRELQFSPPYLTNIAVLITNEAAENLETLDEISTTYEDKTALVYEGTTHEERMQKLSRNYFPEMEMELIQSNEAAIEMTASSNQYFSYVDLPIFWRAQNENKAVKRQSVGDQATESFGFIMPENSDWNKPMEEFFAIGGGYRSNATYRNILVKHLGVEVTKMLQIARKQE